jgi:hypothetical protein
MLPKAIPFQEFLLEDQKRKTIEPGLVFFKELQQAGAWPEKWPTFDQAVVDLNEGIEMLAVSYFKVIKEDPMDMIFSNDAEGFEIVFIEPTSNSLTLTMNQMRERKGLTPFFFHIQPAVPRRPDHG